MTVDTSDFKVWADLTLHPEAEAWLTGHGARLTTTFSTAHAAIVGSLFTGNATAFAKAPQLRTIARVGVGYDRIDVAAATAAGVVATHTPDAPTESTAEFAIALMLTLARRLPIATAGLRQGRWEQGSKLLGQDLAGRTLGLIGSGRIGRRVAEIATSFRMTVLVFDPAQPDLPPGAHLAGDLVTLLREADIVSLHAPLRRETHHLLGAAELAQLRPGALLINTARGPLVDEAALLVALNSGHLAGAGLDVWDPEPPSPDSPLLRDPRVVATPHVAAFTHEGKRRSHLTAAQQIVAIRQGKRPEGVLNPAAWNRRRQ